MTNPTAPQTARVTRAAVTTGVTSTGSLTAITEQNLGFAKGGKITSVAVKVGDRVTAGQMLATIDDFALRQLLAQQQAQLNSQQAVLNRIVNGTRCPAPGIRSASPRGSWTRPGTRPTQVQEADKSAVDRAEKQLGVDKKALENAKKQRRIVKDGCGDSDRRRLLAERVRAGGAGAAAVGDTDGAAASLPDLSSLLTPSSGSSCEQQVAPADRR